MRTAPIPAMLADSARPPTNRSDDGASPPGDRFIAGTERHQEPRLDPRAECRALHPNVSAVRRCGHQLPTHGLPPLRCPRLSEPARRDRERGRHAARGSPVVCASRESTAEERGLVRRLRRDGEMLPDKIAVEHRESRQNLRETIGLHGTTSAPLGSNPLGGGARGHRLRRGGERVARFTRSAGEPPNGGTSAHRAGRRARGRQHGVLWTAGQSRSPIRCHEALGCNGTAFARRSPLAHWGPPPPTTLIPRRLCR